MDLGEMMKIYIMLGNNWIINGLKFEKVDENCLKCEWIVKMWVDSKNVSG